MSKSEAFSAVKGRIWIKFWTGKILEFKNSSSWIFKSYRHSQYKTLQYQNIKIETPEIKANFKKKLIKIHVLVNNQFFKRGYHYGHH